MFLPGTTPRFIPPTSTSTFQSGEARIIDNSKTFPSQTSSAAGPIFFVHAMLGLAIGRVMHELKGNFPFRQAFL
jgi:hypothetical protein